MSSRNLIPQLTSVEATFLRLEINFRARSDRYLQRFTL